MAKALRIYKPWLDKSTNTVKGAASSFEIAVKNKNGFEDVMVFLTMAKEIPSNNDDSAFGWKDENLSVQMKLGDPDCMAILAVIRGFKSVAGPDNGKGLFHQNQKGNSSLKFTYNEEKRSFALEISAKRGDVLTRVYHAVTMEEALMLGILLEEYVKRKYDWNSAVVFEKPQ